MQFIDEKFKDESPVFTVERIKEILRSLGITLEEDWNSTGLDHCWALNLRAPGGIPYSNGKGVSEEFARASAYGEFTERLQSGLLLCKYQSADADPALNFQTYAPDGRYMSKQELIENGEWMDNIIKTYGNGLTREALAEQCLMYAHGDKALCLPFYHIFEKKHVYIPIGFVEHLYSANGNCAGNSREEAWVHALSEILERHGSIEAIRQDISVPAIGEEELSQFKTVRETMAAIRAGGNYDIQVLDFSFGSGFPVIATTVTNKDTHSYVISVGADPVLEIAIERTLTEMFQGRRLEQSSMAKNTRILSHAGDVKAVHNVTNQLQTADGIFNATFFAETKPYIQKFPDRSHRTNKELAGELLDFYRRSGYAVYVRNFSFLGVQCYKFIVPGFSETRGLRLTEPVQEYYFADQAAGALKNLRKAPNEGLHSVLMCIGMTGELKNRRYMFGPLAGIPIDSREQQSYASVHFAYAAYRLNRSSEVSRLLSYAATKAVDVQLRDYILCIRQYLQFTMDGIAPEKAMAVLEKFYSEQILEKLQQSLTQYGDVFGDLLFACDPSHCAGCTKKDICRYDAVKRVIRSAGLVYRNFTDGQKEENFQLD